MKVIISILISLLGSLLLKTDFFALLALVSLAFDLNKELKKIIKLMIKLRCRQENTLDKTV